MLPIFNKYPPRCDLKRYIKFYYTIRSTTGTSSIMENHPQGGVDLIFTRKGYVQFSIAHQKRSTLSDIFVISQQEKPFAIHFSHDTDLTGIAFRAEGFKMFFNVPMAELTNKGVSFNSLGNISLDLLLDQLRKTKSDFSRINILEQYLLNLLTMKDATTDIFQGIYSFIRTQNGGLSVCDLMQMTGYSERTLQRKFKETLGISPKSYLNIIRFNSMLFTLKTMNRLDWHEIIYRYGYYDQAHFIKDFRRYTGYIPTSFLKSNTALSDFFLTV